MLFRSKQCVTLCTVPRFAMIIDVKLDRIKKSRKTSVSYLGCLNLWFSKHTLHAMHSLKKSKLNALLKYSRDLMQFRFKYCSWLRTSKFRGSFVEIINFRSASVNERKMNLLVGNSGSLHHQKSTLCRKPQLLCARFRLSASLKSTKFWI